MTKEVWKAIPGYEGLYEVSGRGRVRSLDRTLIDKNNRKMLCRGQILSPFVVQGYLHIGLYAEGSKKNYSVHILVMLAFKGRPPKGKEVAHRDGIKVYNYLTNLRYATRSENQQDRMKHGTSNAKLTKEEVIEIRRRVINETQTALAKEYGVCIGTISYIATRKNWKHI